MATTAAAPIVKVIEATIQGKSTRLAYEHPWIVRFAHWLNAISLFVLIGSGLRIFLAFPSLGPRIPQKDFFIQVPPAFTIGGWLGGALQWHLTFVWIFVEAGIATSSIKSSPATIARCCLRTVTSLVCGPWRAITFSSGQNRK